MSRASDVARSAGWAMGRHISSFATGFMEDPDVPEAVIAATTDGLAIDPDDIA
jgi:hypothetical protein